MENEVIEKEKLKCRSCGHMIQKRSYLDPYLCYDCEDMMLGEEPEESKYAYPGN